MDLARRTMLAAFKQKKAPTQFLSGFFQTPPLNISRTETVVIDIKRNGEQYAVDILRGAGGRLNRNKQFSTKEYKPPVYDEFTSIGGAELFNRDPGQTEYDSPAFMATVLARVTDDQAEIQEKIIRSIEHQASQVFFTGQIVLSNADTIDYKQKATHNFQTAISWASANGLPLDDIQTAVNLNRKDGKSNSNIALMSEESLPAFLDNPQVVAKANYRRIDQINIKPPAMNVEGAAFHGTFSVGAYTLQLWTYPQFYEVPTGFSLPNEGTLVPYIPANRVLVFSSIARFDLAYGGIPVIANRNDPRLAALGLAGIPSVVPADFHPYMYLDNKARTLNAGVSSSPLCIPTAIDTYTVIETVQ